MIIFFQKQVEYCVSLNNCSVSLLMKIIIIFLSLCCMSMGLSIPSYAENYTYDTGGRLISVIYDDGSSIIYTYDAAGNIISIVTDNDTTDPFDNPDSTLALDGTNSTATISSSTTNILYGSDDNNAIIIEAGGKAKLLNTPGNNTITIEADSSIFTVFRSGAYVTFEGTDGTVLKMPATLESQTIAFDNGSWILVIDSGKVMLESQEISLTPSAIN